MFVSGTIGIDALVAGQQGPDFGLRLILGLGYVELEGVLWCGYNRVGANNLDVTL